MKPNEKQCWVLGSPSSKVWHLQICWLHIQSQILTVVRDIAKRITRILCKPESSISMNVIRVWLNILPPKLLSSNKLAYPIKKKMGGIPCVKSKPISRISTLHGFGEIPISPCLMLKSCIKVPSLEKTANALVVSPPQKISINWDYHREKNRKQSLLTTSLTRKK